MEVKTKEGKYFSQLGSWSDLVRIIVLVLILKIFSYSIFSTVLALVVSVAFLWGVPKLFKKKDHE